MAKIPHSLKPQVPGRNECSRLIAAVSSPCKVVDRKVSCGRGHSVAFLWVRLRNLTYDLFLCVGWVGVAKHLRGAYLAIAYPPKTLAILAVGGLAIEMFRHADLM